MKSFIGLTRRNIMVYMKDRQAVFFSILTPLIVFGLYVLFLKGTFVSGLENALGEAKPLVEEDIKVFANLILLAGVLGSSVITISYSALSTIVRDRETRIDYDISVTPVKRSVIILSYLTAAFICSFLISFGILIGAVLFLTIIGKTYLTFLAVVQLIGITALGSLSATAFFMVLVMLLKSSSSVAAFQGILCAATGFIIGAYIPLSEFSPTVQTIANLFPGSHVTALFRNVLLTGVLEHMDMTLGGVDNHVLMTSLSEAFSLKLSMFELSVPSYLSVIVITTILVGSMGTAAVLYSKVYKRS